MEKDASKSRPLLNASLMAASLVLVLVLLPAVFTGGRTFENFLRASGVKISPNFNDGYLIAEFDDPRGDVLLPLPPDTVYNDARNALDITRFAVKKVKFNALSGIGIEPRLNLCFEFNGKQPNPFEFKNKFSFPVVHVYIKTPGSNAVQNTSDKAARIDFKKDYWRYQVIIDGMHEQPRVFDNTGKFLFDGLGIYVNYEKKEKTIIKTRITAALPLKLIGDPAEGEWKYTVAIGLLDVKNPSMFFRTERDSADVFDHVSLDSSGQVEINPSGRISISPLIVNFSKSSQ
jgi:hypothetical protein